MLLEQVLNKLSSTQKKKLIITTSEFSESYLEDVFCASYEVVVIDALHEESLSKVVGFEQVVVIPNNTTAQLNIAKKIIRRILDFNEIVKLVDTRYLTEGWTVSGFFERGGDKNLFINFCKKYSKVIALDKNPIKYDNKNKIVYFKPLGHLKGRLYFYSYYRNEIIDIDRDELEGENLLQLAPFSFWQKNGGTHANENMKQRLIDACKAKGPFVSHDAFRGLGMHKDGERYLFNTGERVYNGLVGLEPEKLLTQYAYRREHRKSIYVSDHDLDANDKEMLYNYLESFGITKRDDKNIVVGWLFSCLLGDLNESNCLLCVAHPNGLILDLFINSFIRLILRDLHVHFTSFDKLKLKDLLVQTECDHLPILYPKVPYRKKKDRVKLISHLVKTRDRAKRHSFVVPFLSDNIYVERFKDVSKVVKLNIKPGLPTENLINHVINNSSVDFDDEFRGRFLHRILKNINKIVDNKPLLNHFFDNETRRYDREINKQLVTGLLIAGNYNITPEAVREASLRLSKQMIYKKKAMEDNTLFIIDYIINTEIEFEHNNSMVCYKAGRMLLKLMSLHEQGSFDYKFDICPRDKRLIKDFTYALGEHGIKYNLYTGHVNLTAKSQHFQDFYKKNEIGKVTATHYLKEIMPRRAGIKYFPPASGHSDFWLDSKRKKPNTGCPFIEIDREYVHKYADKDIL